MRLLQHAQKPPAPEIEDWVDSFVFSSARLNKAHVRDIEARLIGLANSARQANLINKTQGYAANLDPKDKAIAEGFLSYMLECLEAIGIAYFSTAPTQENIHKEDMYEIRQRDMAAYGFHDGSAFWVKAGSQASQTATSGCPQRYNELRDQLINQGILRKQDGLYVFAEDYRFDSPSAAAAVVRGRAANGWKEWKNVATGKTLDELIRGESSAIETERDESDSDSSSGTLLPSVDEPGDEL